LRQGQVQGVVRQEVVAQIPDASTQRSVRVADDAQLVELGDGLAGLPIGDVAAAQEAPERVDDLRFDELRGMQYLPPICERRCRWATVGRIAWQSRAGQGVPVMVTSGW